VAFNERGCHRCQVDFTLRFGSLETGRHTEKTFGDRVFAHGMLLAMGSDELLSEPLRAPARHEVDCRACGGSLAPTFEAVILQDLRVTYERCGSCGSLMLLNPHWLGRAYAKVIVPNPDFGALRRTLFVHRFLRRLRGAGLLPRSYRSLDFGSGLGMLVRLQRDHEVDAWGYDVYATPKFAETYCGNELPNGKFDLVTCVEVLEHTTNPVDVLKSFRSRMNDDGLVAVSTELVDGQADPKSWHYLALEHGQHITLFSRAGLSAAADAAGFEWVRSVALDGVPFLHLLAPKGARPSWWKVLRLCLQQWVGEFNQRSDHRI
jgi:hypothetical protein